MKKSLENKLQKQRQSHLKMHLKKSPNLATLFIYAVASLAIFGFAACNSSGDNPPSGPSGVPSFTYPEGETAYMFRVRHSLTTGGTVGTVEAAAPSGASITYSLDSNEDSAFAIGESSGAISAAAGLMTKTYTLSVVAANSTDTNLSSTASVSVVVVSAEPAFDAANYTFSIRTLLASGGSIGSVSAQIPFGDQVSYAFASNGNPDDFFVINESTGAITRSTTGTLTEASHSLKVLAVNTEVTSQTKEVMITVEAASAEPAFDAANYTFSIRTSLDSGGSVGSVSAQVPFGDPVSYAFASNGNPDDFFAIDAGTGAITRSTTGMVMVGDSHSLRVIAANTEVTSQTKEVMITVNVPSEEPVFDPTASDRLSSVVLLSSGAAIGRVSAQVPFGDPVSYAFASDGNPGNFFAIDAGTGAITRSPTGTLMVGDSHSLKVVATNTQVTSQTKEKTITVTVCGLCLASSSELKSGSGNVPTLVSGDNFGHSLGYLGDIDGANTGSVGVLAVGADGSSGTKGAVHLLYLNADGGTQSSTTINAATPNVPTLGSNSYFGSSLAWLGDIDGAGSSTGVLAVGARYANKVYLLYINADGSVASTITFDTDTPIGGDPTDTLPINSGEVFGEALAWLGDIDGAGSSVGVLAVGTEYGDKIYLLFLNADSNGVLSVGKSVEFDDDDISTDATEFGNSLAWLGDIDGAGASAGVLAVGAIGNDNQTGAVYLLYLNTDGTLQRTSAKIDKDTTNGPPALASSGFFGSSLAWLGDRDGSGGSAGVLAVGAEGDALVGKLNAGAVYLLYLNADGTLSRTFEASGSSSAASTLPSFETNYLFGTSLVWLGDLSDTDSSQGILSAGVPGRNNSGVVYQLSYDF